ncbi:MAG: hypothetical protein ABFR89_02450 [Actinomycetota bacterium]
MKIVDALPTYKVTAFALGGAVTVAAFWLLIEVGVLEGWPEAFVLAAFALIVGFFCAWFVPEGVWSKVDAQAQDSPQP